MPDVNHSESDKGLLVESWYVELADYVIGLDVSPDASKIAAVTVEGLVFLISDLGDSAHFKLIGEHAGGANSVSWRCDGTEFATAGHDGLVKIWNGVSGLQLNSLEAGDLWVAKAVYNPHRKVLATAAGKHLKLWNEKREVVYESADHASTIADVGWKPDGKEVATAAYNGVTLHRFGHKKRPRKYTWKGSSLVLAWSADGKYIATGEQDSTVHFWHVKSGDDAQMSGFPTKVLELAWDSSGKWLATGGGTSICVWDCSGKGPAGRRPRQFDTHLNKLTQLGFQPNGQFLVSADTECLMLWDPISQEKVIGGVMLSSPASCLKWGKGDKFAVGQEDGKVVVFNILP